MALRQETMGVLLVMTTTVKIEAHCADTKEVRICIYESIKCEVDPVEAFTIQDGETKEVYAYDDREIVVREVDKSTE